MKIETAYKLIVVYAGIKKKSVVYYVIKSPRDMEKLLEIKAALGGDPDAVSVTLVRTRKPRTYNYDQHEPVVVDDSGTVSTPKERSLMFSGGKSHTLTQTPRTDVEKAEWARNNKYDNRTCLWH